MPDLETRLRSLLKGEYSSLTISFNDHAANYLSVAQAVEQGDLDDGDWVSEEEKARAIAANSVWTIQWYPRTPIGFCTLHAATLEAAVDAALKSP